MILAQFDARSIVVYQAYRPSIARFAVENGRFGGDFSFSRMSWIKPNFLWMMYRSAWGRSEGQEHVLAVRIERALFDEMLEAAVPSSFWPERFESERAWKDSLARSDVRLQWDPDHDPSGAKLERRALQLGLRREMLARYAAEALVSVEDISELVARQRVHALARDWVRLETPREEPYPIPAAARWVVGAGERD